MNKVLQKPFNKIVYECLAYECVTGLHVCSHSTGCIPLKYFSCSKHSSGAAICPGSGDMNSEQDREGLIYMLLTFQS